MTVLLSEQLSAGQQELADTLRDPEVICHTWTVDGDKSDYDGTVLAYQDWLSGGFTPCRHLRPSSGREHTIVTYSVR